MTPEQLKASILQCAIQGKLVEQRSEDGTAEELYLKIQKEKQDLVKAGKIKKEKSLADIAEDEVPFDIPETWKWVYLQSVSYINGGYAFKSADYTTNGVRVVRISDFNEEGFVNTKIVRHPFSEDLSPYLLNEGDILLCMTGGTVGKSYFVEKLPEKMMTNQRVATIKSLCNIQEYVKYVILSPITQRVIQHSKNSTNDNISMDTINGFLVPLPPEKEIARIIQRIKECLTYVDRYAEAYEKMEQFNAKFPEDMKKSILQYAIQGKLVEQRPEEGTAEDLYQQIQEEKNKLIKEGKIKKEKLYAEITDDEIPFDIPESWKWAYVGETCLGFEYGTAKKSQKNGNRIVLRMGNIQKGKIIYDNLVYSDDEEDIKKYNLKKGDLLFNRTNSKEWVGKTAIYLGEKPAIYAGYLVRFRPILIDSQYLNYVMQTRYYWEFCQQERTDAIGQSNINAQKLKKFMFPLPPLGEQRRIVAKIEELLPYCEQLIK